jgi:hypothetical protein
VSGEPWAKLPNGRSSSKKDQRTIVLESGLGGKLQAEETWISSTADSDRASIIGFFSTTVFWSALLNLSQCAAAPWGTISLNAASMTIFESSKATLPACSLMVGIVFKSQYSLSTSV